MLTLYRRLFSQPGPYFYFPFHWHTSSIIYYIITYRFINVDGEKNDEPKK